MFTIAICVIIVVASTVNGNVNRYIRQDLMSCLRATRNNHKLSDYKRDQLTRLFEFGLRVDWSEVIPELDSGLDDSRFHELLLQSLSPLKGHLPIHYPVRYRIASAFINEMAKAINDDYLKDVDELGIFLIDMYTYIRSRKLSTSTRVFLRKTEHYMMKIITAIHVQGASVYSSEDPDENDTTTPQTYDASEETEVNSSDASSSSESRVSD